MGSSLLRQPQQQQQQPRLSFSSPALTDPPVVLSCSLSIKNHQLSFMLSMIPSQNLKREALDGPPRACSLYAAQPLLLDGHGPPKVERLAFVEERLHPTHRQCLLCRRPKFEAAKSATVRTGPGARSKRKSTREEISFWRALRRRRTFVSNITRLHRIHSFVTMLPPRPATRRPVAHPQAPYRSPTAPTAVRILRTAHLYLRHWRLRR